MSIPGTQLKPIFAIRVEYLCILYLIKDEKL